MNTALLARHQAAPGELVGVSLPMQRVQRMVRQASLTRATVLVTGESGTGKGHVARVIHALSPRKTAPFISVLCLGLDEGPLEAELFGHHGFGGTDSHRPGRIEQAAGGTLFLDEIGELPTATQRKLLRLLEERALEHPSARVPIPIDVRVVATTSRDLASHVREGRFREDLYCRLNVVHIGLPSLRLCGSDALLLAEHFLKRFASENQRSIEGFSEAARAKISAHGWPGNVRELKHAVERAVVFSEGPLVEASALPFESAPAGLDDVRSDDA